jgi:hypothetical protein
MAGLYLTDGLSVVDVSEAHADKAELPRYIQIKNVQDKDVTQTFGTLGRTITIDGVWDIADGRNDGRAILEYWKTNNIVVRYDDEQVTTLPNFGTIGWYNVIDFKWDIQRGRSTVIIQYHIELTESLRVTVDDNLTLPSGVYAPALRTPTPSPNSRSSDIGFGAMQFSHNKHTFVDQNNSMWIASLQSSGQNPSVISFCMSSGGAEWSWISDYGYSEPNRGWAVRFFYPNSVGITWANEHTLMFVAGSISYPGPIIAWGTPTSVNSTATANEGNFKPDLFITPTPRYYISACSSNNAFIIYDSNDGVNWIAQAGFAESLVTDPQRYSAILVTYFGGYIKRVFFQDSYGSGIYQTKASYLWTKAYMGATESDYSNDIGSGYPSGVQVDYGPVMKPSCGYFAVTALPFASYGSVFMVDWDGANWSVAGVGIDETRPSSPLSWPSYINIISPVDGTPNPGTQGYLVPQFLSVGLSSAEDQCNLFCMVNGFPKFARTWNLRSDRTTPSIIAPKFTFGTGSVGAVAYLNTPDIPTLSQSFLAFQEQLGNVTTEQTIYTGVP